MIPDFQPPYVLLEDRLTPASGARLFRHPREIVACDDPAGVLAALERISAAVGYGAHAAGFVAYEAGYALEPRLAPLAKHAEAPLLWFGIFEQVEIIPSDVLDEALAGLAPPSLREVRPACAREEHVERVRRALGYIRAGDIYQVNLTFPIAFDCDQPPLALYAALRARQPAAHGGVVHTGRQAILSVSPELFVAQEGERLTTRPMKGTCARGGDARADLAAARALAGDPKQRAENLMIVDLLRNDLSRICAPGSVRVEDLFRVETYPTLHTLTSTVSGRTGPDLAFTDLMRALFPCGSIVGTPKIRAAQIIAELEAAPRGLYTGAIGVLGPGGATRLSVAIRTCVVESDGRGAYGVGGGVVADSDPDSEYDEALLKAEILVELAREWRLIETLGWTSGEGFALLEGHIARLARSARALGFALDRAAFEAALNQAAKGWGRGSRRVRCLLARDGSLSLTATDLAPEATAPARAAVAAETLDQADPFLRHKTTRRPVHERALAAAAARGLDEAVLLNRAGRIADATHHTVFVERGGQLLTPPVRDGALPGVLRAALISEGRAVEAALTPADLVGARWFLGNSVRGLRAALLD